MQLIPNHMAALHICTDDISEHLRHYSIITAASLKLRSRCKFHYGSQTECLYQMSTYGIPPSFLPFESGGKDQTITISKKLHMNWLESRFRMERQSDRPLSSVVIAAPSNQLIVDPNENDILLIGGNKSHNMGNQRLRALVKDMSQAYETGNKESRKALVDCVQHSLVHESGGRFLKQHHDVDGGGWDKVWKELPKEQIRKTIAQAFFSGLLVEPIRGGAATGTGRR